MNQTAKHLCLERCNWYVERIDDLLRLMQEKPRLDEDDVQMCQAMLREIQARFRADRRPATDGRISSAEEAVFLGTIAEADDRLHVNSFGRPNRRWLDDLNLCRASMAKYLEDLAAM